MIPRRCRFFAALVAAAFASPAGAQEPSRAYEGLEAIEISFANGPVAMAHVPHMWLGLRGVIPGSY